MPVLQNKADAENPKVNQEGAVLPLHQSFMTSGIDGTITIPSTPAISAPVTHIIMILNLMKLVVSMIYVLDFKSLVLVQMLNVYLLNNGSPELFLKPKKVVVMN